MSRRVLDVGNCAPDHVWLRSQLQSHFDVEVVAARTLNEALEQLRRDTFDLVTVNRILDQDGTRGLDVIRAIKGGVEFADVPVMMITNMPEYQLEARAAGAEPGFGKNALQSVETMQGLARYLGP